MWPDFSASIMAASSANAPRAVLTRMTPGFIAAVAEMAIGFMVEHTALAENNIANEVDRYLAMPGQALAYKLGQLEILRLREVARTALGDRFEIGGFHDAVLGQGAVGLPSLAALIEAWIEGRRAH